MADKAEGVAQVDVASAIISPIDRDIVAHLAARDNVEVRTILDTAPFDNHDQVEQAAAAMCSWADLLVLAPLDANSFAKMLHGVTDNQILEIVRSWDVSKRVLLVLGMSTLMWENPMTKKQLSKIRRKWNWVRVLQPLLWAFESGSGSKKYLPWEESREELLGAIQNQVDLMQLGHDVDLTLGHASKNSLSVRSARKTTRSLPPEIWSMILDFTNDWELAKALNVYTTLPTPQSWQRAASKEGPQTLMEKLEWAILAGTLDDVKALFNAHPAPPWLSTQAIRIIMRFGMVSLLKYLEEYHKDLFWASFGHAFLPDKASAVFGRVEILEYWRTSPTFLNKEYTIDAVDGASRAGFVHVLEWWRKSGLPLKYTEAALEQASSKGQIEVLDWWKNASMREDGQVRAGGDESESEGATASPLSRRRGPLRLKPGKAIAFATQAGSRETLQWWVTSSVPFSHEDTVAKLASTHGHVGILDFWHSLHGEKMIYDNQVLVGATKMGHRDVLEWWKCSGLRVEYKTCDIEEALEDGVEGVKGQQVRRWWAENGLNLGVGTSEWMRTKLLN
ncbi:uncharacterized protein K452DRAFT_320487 [Aplosporella prunicola CBS 121167]|uniref:Flavoprotein domain-containing protein n=1 Tax=Aplosporella prunicola CBS 121167 TaxID=1176127 RepID=A0A6A6B662_9PEZI|nr:uncharacterized protein K452DRAFT_320487 [Aplosporella prunicola CBS 121167]KAF2139356.1 hypothetical protein K452DRAFT_320487 [Aplosporella prunicola CBS 121167]